MWFLHAPKTPLDRPVFGSRTFYCQAFMLDAYKGRTLVWHNGSTPGGKSILMLDHDAGIGIVVLSNLQGTMLPEALAMSFIDLYFDFPQLDRSARAAKHMQRANRNPLQPTPPITPIPPRPLDAYVGEYSHPTCGPIRISKNQDTLHATLGTVTILHSLQHYDGDTFWLVLPMVDVDASGFVHFDIAPNGKAVQLSMDAFLENGIGVFARQSNHRQP